MYLNFDEKRPDTPRVPAAFSKLERVLMAVVAYQALLLAYFLAPNSWFVQPVKQLIADEPIRYVQIEPLVNRTAAAPKKIAPPSEVDRSAMTQKPVPMTRNEAPPLKANTPDRAGGPTDTPKAAETPQPTMGQRDQSPVPRQVPGGILGNAMKNLDQFVQSQGNDSPEGGPGESGSDVQFDQKGIDFGPWLRRFRAQVYRNWLIPQAAQVLAGHVVIQMTILRNGTIVNPHIVRGSGVDSFDTAALAALKLSNPTMRLPDNYPAENIDPFTVTFYYNERIR